MSKYDYTSESVSLDDSNEEIISSEENTSKQNFLNECAVNADQMLVSLGMEPCAAVWTKPSFKDERNRIMRLLVEMRDSADSYRKVTGDIAFFLNAPFLFSQSKNLKDPKSNNWSNATLTAFNTFYMECTNLWPSYNPDMATYTSYMSYLKHKVRNQSKEEPDQYDANRLYQYNKLLKYEEELIEKDDLSTSDMKTALHIKSGYSMTIIEGYFQWKIQRTPVSIEMDNSPVPNLPLSEEQKRGKSHLRGPEESAIDNDLIARWMERVDEMLDKKILPDNGDPAKVHDLIYQLATGSCNTRKAASEFDLTNVWPRIKNRLRSDPVLCNILGLEKPSKKKHVVHKSASVLKADISFQSDDEEEMVVQDYGVFSSFHSI